MVPYGLKCPLFKEEHLVLCLGVALCVETVGWGDGV